MTGIYNVQYIYNEGKLGHGEIIRDIEPNAMQYLAYYEL